MFGAPYDTAFKNVQFKNDEIYKNTNLPTDPDFIKTDVAENKQYGDYSVKNYRKAQYTKNPNYVSKVNHTFYDRLGIHDGKGAGRNVDADDMLTRGELTNKPADRLQEKVNEIRYYDYMPVERKNFINNEFLVSTTLSIEPQKGYNPSFEIYGRSTTHFNRKSEQYYKNYKM